MATEKRSSGKLFVGGVLVLALAGGAVYYLSSAKEKATHSEAEERSKEVAAGIRVRVAPVTPSSPERTITVAGEVKPYTSVTLYSKVSGYLKSITVDKGDDVREGQLIASIESPEVDRSIQGAQADAKNKRSIAKRNEELLKQGILSQQEADQAIADAETAEANLAGLSQQKAYLTIKAPFAGKVTARYADPGALVQSAASSQSSALPVVTVSQINKLRIYVYLDQHDAVFIREGDTVTIRLPERPDVRIPATITRFTGEIDSKTRTLLAEIDIDNSKGEILSGSYVQVDIKIKARPYLEMPSDALIIKGKEFYAAVVDSIGILHMKKIEIADNDGRRVQIASGLSAGDQIALGVGDAVKDGEKVQPMLKGKN